MFQSLFGSLLNYRYGNENVSLRHLSWICITSILTTIYWLKNCSVYGRSCRIYSPKSFGFFRINFFIFFLSLENAALGLRPRAVFSRPRSQFFTIRTSQPANNIYIFLTYPSFWARISNHATPWIQTIPDLVIVGLLMVSFSESSSSCVIIAVLLSDNRMSLREEKGRLVVLVSWKSYSCNSIRLLYCLNCWN